MTQDEIIRMGRECGFTDVWLKPLERFAALVAAHERERQAEISAIPIIIETAVKEAVLAEREACAKMCDDIDTEYEGEDVLATWCAAAIRSRSDIVTGVTARGEK